MASSTETGPFPRGEAREEGIAASGGAHMNHTLYGMEGGWMRRMDTTYSMEARIRQRDSSASCACGRRRTVHMCAYCTIHTAWPALYTGWRVPGILSERNARTLEGGHATNLLRFLHTSRITAYPRTEMAHQASAVLLVWFLSLD
jgi:hypothetical protein